MDVLQLFGAVQAAYETVKAKEAVKDETGAAYHAASEDYQAALASLNDYRGQLNDILGNVAKDPRVRQG